MIEDQIKIVLQDETKKEITEKDVWLAVAVAVASSNNSTRPEAMITWADKAADKFSERFKVNR